MISFVMLGPHNLDSAIPSILQHLILTTFLTQNEYIGP